jgi:hypothetical protein
MTNAANFQPLTKNDLANLQKAAYELNQALLELEKAESAGIDLSEEKLRIAHQKARIESLLQAYGKVSSTN